MPRITKRTKELNDIIFDYLEYCNYKNLSNKTIKSYSQTLLLFAKYLEEEKQITDIKKVDKNVVEEYLKFTKERGKYSYTSSIDTLNKNYMDMRSDINKPISNSTLNSYLRNIKAFFTYLEDNNIVKNSNIHECKSIKVERKAKEQLTDAEFNKLIKSIDCTKYSEFRDYTIVNLIFDTGMRLNETLNLTIDDVDIMRRTILIPAEINKGKKDRVVFYSDKMSKIFQRWLKFKDNYVENELLFPTQRSTNLSISNFERNFKIYLKRSSINKNITPHGLRNNFARRCLLSGMPLVILSKILGHSFVTITEAAYLDLQNEDLRRKYKNYSPLMNLK
ncbi:tyrosine-type recombinase/integrase [Clostridium sp. UBA1056]|uniref:tyrosine-type recombinase/integrase n=1 Tax=unclassified Clostridium TaxID=2614128 RepID=UPI003216C568